MPNKHTMELITGIRHYKARRSPVLPSKPVAAEAIKMLVEGAIDRLQDGLYEDKATPAIQEAIVLLLAAQAEELPCKPVEL